ncbi:MAG: aminotransferase class IV [Bacteroidota bacterium]
MNAKAPPPLLLESIRILDGTADLLPYHQQRMDRARRVLFPKSAVLKLEKILAELKLPTKGLYKLRIEYNSKVMKTEFVPYIMRPVNSIRIVKADEVRYGRKFADRTGIRKCLEKKGKCDDILMIQRGHVTDASYANVAFFDGKHWYTPAWPLLRGTRREALLEQGVIRPSVIRERDLVNFQSVRLINAMLPWGEAPTLGMEAVV